MRRDGTVDAATTSSTGTYSDSYTYPATGTYTVNVTFQGSPTTLPPSSPGAAGIFSDYLLPCGPPSRRAHARPVWRAGWLVRQCKHVQTCADSSALGHPVHAHNMDVERLAWHCQCVLPSGRVCLPLNTHYTSAPA